MLYADNGIYMIDGSFRSGSGNVVNMSIRDSEWVVLSGGLRDTCDSFCLNCSASDVLMAPKSIDYRGDQFKVKADVIELAGGFENETCSVCQKELGGKNNNEKGQ